MTQQELFSHITYNPDTGVMKRNKSRSNAAMVTAATSLKIGGVCYSATKLVWLYVTGAFPDKELITLDGTAGLKFDNITELGIYEGVVPTQAMVRKYFVYNPYTGKLYWKLRANKASIIGNPAGTVTGMLPNAGYVTVGFFGKQYLVHRLIWLYIHGKWPEKQIDHINHDRTDNRIHNLRTVSHYTNMKNKSLYSTNRSGYSGVEPHGENWKARIGVKGTKVLLGVFSTYKEAVAARQAGEKLLEYHSNHGNIKV